MPAPVASFRSMSTALAYILGEEADHYFTITENRKYVLAALDMLPSLERSGMTAQQCADALSTMAEFAADNVPASCIGVTVQNSHYCGSILVHYADNQDIVRFLAIRAVL